MAKQLQKLELTWIGKGEEPKLEPRILLEDASKSFGDPDAENKLIHGDNLLALKALEQDYTNKVKCIYIDPPYNTGSAFEHYDDGIEHSLWLNLLKPRLEILKNLLRDDGALWISIDDNECHYLKVLCDGIFGRRNFIANIIWEKRLTRENRRKFSFNHDHILLYSKNKEKFENSMSPLNFSEEARLRYKNPDNDSRGPWQSVPMLAQTGHATKSQFYTIQTPSGKLLDPPPGNCWRYTEQKFEEEVEKGNIFFTKGGDGVPRIKKFLKDNIGLTPETIWTAKEVGTNDSAKKHVVSIFKNLNVAVFDTPKPEELIERIINLSTDINDLVLDSFLGSGTTAAVAHKMNRKWIGIELGEHAVTHCLPRLKQVVSGTDKGGITEAVNWKDGGGFKFYTLAPSLILKDKYGNDVINPAYNANMLAAAMAKQQGFHYKPNETVYWKQGFSSEKDFIFTTTQFITVQMLDRLSEELQANESLLICCKSFAKGCLHRHCNITIKKIPQMVLGKCEFGKDDYSLNIINLPEDLENKSSDDNETEIQEMVSSVKSKKAGNNKQSSLFE